mgnify:CR=1 FL=1
MKDGSFIIRVEKTRAGSAVPVGMTSQPIRGQAMIGRGPTADFQLADPTVASEHVLLENLPDGFGVRVMTERGTTFINRRRVQPQEFVLIDTDRGWLQLGRVLISVVQVMATLPFDDMVSFPTGAMEMTSDIWLTVQVVPRCRVWIRGELVSLFPSAARVLALLASRPGEVFSTQELTRAMDPEGHHMAGGAKLSQSITYIRNMFDKVLEHGLLDEEMLREQVRQVVGSPLLDTDLNDRRALLRALVESQRGVGYRLRLPQDVIAPVKLP